MTFNVTSDGSTEMVVSSGSSVTVTDASSYTAGVPPLTVVVPSAIAVKVVVAVPSAPVVAVAGLTVPTVVSVLIHPIATPSIGLSSWSYAVAVNCRVSVTFNVTSDGSTEMVVRTGTSTSTTNIALLASM